MTLEELTAWLKEQGEPAFRARQIFKWLYRGVTSFAEMTDLSKQLRQKLEERCTLTPPQVAQKQVSVQDGTIKYLWQLADGNCVDPGRDGGSGSVYQNGQRGARFQHRFNGNRGTVGQL